ncbi:MAG: hypothetical protein KDA37_17650 [Planctomycetales bacterium]|nr:hypothetical protein [Planctomycetales bacterium]
MTLLEVVVAVGLLALIMVLMVSLLTTSSNVLQASQGRHERGYALEAAAALLRGAEAAQVATTRLRAQFATGQVGNLAFDARTGNLTWEIDGSTQILVRDLAAARFSVEPQSDGQLIRLAVATRAARAGPELWSHVVVWIRPHI